MNDIQAAAIVDALLTIAKQLGEQNKILDSRLRDICNGTLGER